MNEGWDSQGLVNGSVSLLEWCAVRAEFSRETGSWLCPECASSLSKPLGFMCTVKTVQLISEVV